MDNYTSQHEITDLLAVSGVPEKAVTAGGSGDDTLYYGPIIDRLQDGGPFDACLHVLAVEGVIGEGEKLTAYSLVQHDSDAAGGTMANYVPPNDEGTSGIKSAEIANGTVEKGVLQHTVDLSGAKRYIRAGGKVNMSASGTDTAKWHSVLLLGGSKKKPFKPTTVTLG